MRLNSRSEAVNSSARESWVAIARRLDQVSGTSLGESVVADVNSKSAASVCRPGAVAVAENASANSKTPAGWFADTWIDRTRMSSDRAALIAGRQAPSRTTRVRAPSRLR